MQPEDGNITTAAESPPAPGPHIDPQALEQGLETALAEVEHCLEAWLGAVQAREAFLAEAQQRLEQRERRLAAGEQAEAKPDEIEEGQARTEALVDPREADLAERQAQLAAGQAPLDEPASEQIEAADAESQSGSDAEPDAPAAAKERVLRRLGGPSGEEALGGPPETPATSLAPPDEAEVVQPGDVVTAPITEPRAEPAEDPVAGPTDSNPANVPAAADISSVDLDPETARKLRVLRRLAGPGKSDAELLAQLAAREPGTESQEKAKKRWWKRGR